MRSQRHDSRKRQTEQAKSKLKDVIFPTGYCQSVVPVEKIEFGIIALKNGDHVKILEVDPLGFSKLKNKDKNKTIDAYFTFLKNIPSQIQVHVVTEKTDVTSLIAPFEEKLKKENDRRMIKSRQDNINLIRSMSYGESYTKRYFLIIKYEGNPNTGIKSSDINEIVYDFDIIVNQIKSGLRACGNNLVEHENENGFLEEVLYRFFNRKSSETETLAQRKTRIKNDIDRLRFEAGEPYSNVMPPVSSIIAPRGIQPSFDYIIVDGVYYSFVALKEDGYPEFVTATWTNLLTSSISDYDMYFVEEDTERIIDSLERSRAQHSVLLKQQTEQSAQQEMYDAISAAEYMINRIRMHDKFYYCVTLLTISGRSYGELVENRGTVLRYLKSYSLMAETVNTEIERYYRMTMPLIQIDNGIFKHYRRNMTSEGVAACYPFDGQMLRDEGGIPIGTCTDSGSLAIYNMFNTSRYNNANIGIFGPSGSGKTYFSLALARRLRLLDIGVLFVLPEKAYEYKMAVESLGGEFITLSGGSNHCINIFDITAEATLSQQELLDLEITATSKLQAKINEISTFFELLFAYPNGMTALQYSKLEVAVVDLYHKYGITADNASLYNPDGSKKVCPIIQDFYDLIKERDDMNEFCDVLQPFITGGKRNLNGQTNVFINNKVVAFDVSQNSQKDQPLFIFLAQNICFSKMKENRTDRYACMIDEAWKMMVNRNSANAILTFAKLVRGYAGSVIIATQNLVDFTNTDMGDQIVSNLNTKFILKVGDGEEEINKMLFKLTDEQVAEMSRQEKGHITMIANKEVYAITTAMSKLEDALYTTDASKIKQYRPWLIKEGYINGEV